jgi:cell wall-associated NlpC family hydrolase
VFSLGAAVLALGCAQATQETAPRASVPRRYLPPPAWSEPLPPETDPAATAIAFAEAQLGKRYCWGGTGPNCFDCSGLVQSAWRAAGTRLPRTTNDQARALVSVPLGDVRPGDIFWWSHGHVGIYVGNGAIIDAYHSGAGVVRRWAPRPERVLRVVPASPLQAPHAGADIHRPRS